MDAHVLFLQFTVELVSTQILAHKAAALQLYKDWIFARARLWAEIVTKLFYFRQLPWHLIALGHHKHDVAVLAARECLKLWDDVNSPGRQHRQSQRFLDEHFVGDDDQDVPLRGYVERLAQGASFDELQGPFTKMLARLRSIRVSERSVEGIHSLVTKCYRRAPAASLPYISVELRLQHVVTTLMNNPSVAWLASRSFILVISCHAVPHSCPSVRFCPDTR